MIKKLTWDLYQCSTKKRKFFRNFQSLINIHSKQREKKLENHNLIFYQIRPKNQINNNLNCRNST